MIRKTSICFVFMILMLGILSPTPMQIKAEEDHLIIRVVDAHYPPSASKYVEENLTLFGFEIYFQIENPTQSEITIFFNYTPVEFPHLKTDLENEALEARVYTINWAVAGDFTIQPGNIISSSCRFYFEIVNHLDISLPLGKYEMWLDFTNSSYTTVPVVTEKLVVNVTETNITYSFEYDDDTRIVSPIITLKANSISISFLSSIYLLLAAVKILNRKKNRI